MTSLADIVEDRLTTRESVVGANEPSLGNIAKHFFRFEAAASDTVKAAGKADSAECLRREAVAYHDLLKALSRYEFHIQSGAVVQDTCKKEIEHYVSSESNVEEDIKQTELEIEELKNVLQIEQMRRAQKVERENLARLVNTHRTHEDLEAELAALEKRQEKIDVEAALASEAVSMRQRQVRLLLASLQELKSMWENDEKGWVSGKKGQKDLTRASGGNNMIDEDEDEEEEETSRGRYEESREEDNDVNMVENHNNGIEDGEIIE